MRVDESGLDRVDRFLEILAGPIEAGQGPYGPAVAAPQGASRLERTVARTGRDPRWDLSR